MGEGSPLFHSALELLAHAIEHYAAGQDRDRKFMVLHLANAAELLLKDCMLDAQKSIYRNPKETKSVYAVMEELEEAGISIPRKHFLEILIDERNNIQHRFGSQSEIMAKWYMDRMIEFFDAFMEDRFGVNLRGQLGAMLGKDVLQYVYPDIADRQPLITARQIAKLHPSAAVLTAWIEVENKVKELGAKAVRAGISPKEGPSLRHAIPAETLEYLSEALPSQAPKTVLKEFMRLEIARTLIVHGTKALDEKEARKLIDQTEELLAQLDEVLASIPTNDADDGEDLASE